MKYGFFRISAQVFAIAELPTGNGDQPGRLFCSAVQRRGVGQHSGRVEMVAEARAGCIVGPERLHDNLLNLRCRHASIHEKDGIRLVGRDLSRQLWQQLLHLDAARLNRETAQQRLQLFGQNQPCAIIFVQRIAVRNDQDHVLFNRIVRDWH